jgi:hypothetical protein
MDFALYGPISNIERANSAMLAKQLRERGIRPARALQSLRAQARNFNANLNLAQSSSVVSTPRRMPNYENLSEAPELTTIPENRICQQISLPPSAQNQAQENFVPCPPNTVYVVRDQSCGVANWRISFDGSSGSDVRNFLMRIDELCESRRFPRSELPRVFTELLSGEALTWFRQSCRNVSDWNSLRKLLIDRFDDPSRQWQRKLSIVNLKQEINEPASSFIGRVLYENGTLTNPFLPVDVLTTLRQGLLPKYSPAVLAAGSDTIKGLEKACREFDLIYGTSSRSPVPANKPFHQARRNTAVGIVSSSKNTAKQNSVCYKCGRKGHFQRDCYSRVPSTRPSAVIPRNASIPPVVVDVSRPPPNISKSVNKPKFVGSRPPGSKSAGLSSISFIPSAETAKSERDEWLKSVALFFKTLEVHKLDSTLGRDGRPYIDFRISQLTFRGLLDSGAVISVIGRHAHKHFLSQGAEFDAFFRACCHC